MEKTNSIRQLPWKILYLAFAIYLGVFFLLLSGYFFQILPLSWAFGWAVGAIVTTLNYLLIILQAKRIQLSLASGMKTRSQPLYMVGRLGLFATGLVLAVLVKNGDQEIFNVFSTFFAYLVISGVIFISGAQFKTRKQG